MARIAGVNIPTAKKLEIALTSISVSYTHLTVIRSANTGISAVIAPNGDVSGLIGLNEEGVSDTALPKVLAVNSLLYSTKEFSISLPPLNVVKIIAHIARKGNYISFFDFVEKFIANSYFYSKKRDAKTSLFVSSTAI